MSKVTLFQAREFFLQERRQRNYAQSTLRNYRRYLEKFFSYLKIRGITELSAVTLKLLVDYQQYLSNLEIAAPSKSYSPESIGNFLKSLRQFFRFLKKKEMILIDPTEGLPSFQTPERFPRGIMTRAEVELILSLPDLSTLLGFRDRVILEILYSTGIRRQELINLSITDIDLNGGFVWVRQGKGKKDRVVPLGKIAVKYTREYLEKVRPGLARGREKRALFLNPYGYPLVANRLSRIIKDYVQKSGLKKRISCHSFRHTCATEMLRGGCSVRYVQELLGHSNIRTTQIYTRVVPLDLKKAHQKAHPRERQKNKDVPVFNLSSSNKSPCFFKLKQDRKKASRDKRG